MKARGRSKKKPDIDIDIQDVPSRTPALRLQAFPLYLLSTVYIRGVSLCLDRLDINIQYTICIVVKLGFYTLHTGILVNWQRDVDVWAYMRLTPIPGSECRHGSW